MIKLPDRFKLVEKAITGSTNDDAKRLAEEGASDFTLVWAREQTAGRGRLGRTWVSEPGNLFWSLVLRHEALRQNPERVVFVTAMATVSALRQTLPDPSKLAIKWPNDVLIDGAKFSGTLAESSVQQGWVVVGVGINLKTSPKSGQTIYPTTCLIDAGCSITSVDELCERFSAAFDMWYDIWLEDGLNGEFRQSYNSFLWKLGSEIEVSLNADKTKKVKGKNIGIDSQGFLQLEMESGSVISINTGDVLFG